MELHLGKKKPKQAFVSEFCENIYTFWFKRLQSWDKVFAVFLSLSHLNVSDDQKILISDKENMSKYKIWFINEDCIY